MLEVREVSKNFGGLRALDRVSLHVKERQIYGLIGPNGAGKTTLFNLLTGLLRATEGSIRFRDQELIRLPPHAIAALGIARTFQNIRLLINMTVLENVLVAQNLRTRAGLASLLPVRSRAERALREKAEGLLRRAGLWEKRSECAAALAYGEQRRLEIARALAMEPSMLLLDEPAAGMNDAEVEQLQQQIQAIQVTGKTILLIEHRMHMVMSACDHVTVLNFGRAIAEGSPREIQANQAVVEAYLGGEEM